MMSQNVSQSQSQNRTILIILFQSHTQIWNRASAIHAAPYIHSEASVAQSIICTWLKYYNCAIRARMQFFCLLFMTGVYGKWIIIVIVTNKGVIETIMLCENHWALRYDQSYQEIKMYVALMKFVYHLFAVGWIGAGCNELKFIWMLATWQ